MASPNLSSLLARLKEVEVQWKRNIQRNPHNEVVENANLPGRDDTLEYPASIALYGICDLAEDAMSKGLDAAQLNEFLEAASALESTIIDREYGGSGMDDDGLDFIPISCKNVVKEAGGPRMKASAYTQLIKILAGFTPTGGKKINPDDLADTLADKMGQHKPYNPDARPSKPHSTPLARFCDNRPAVPSDASPQLTAFLEARCEILSDNIPLPIQMAAADDVVAVISAAGWKQRAPVLSIQRLALVPKASRTRNWDAFGTISPDVGLASVAHHLRVDGSRKLVWVGDDERIKSYQWQYDQAGANGEALAVHTLDSNRFDNAIILRDGGARILRSGSGGLATWDVESLSTHGPQGTNRVGKKLKGEIDTMRDDPEDIERSAGSPPTSKSTSKVLSDIVVAENHPSTEQLVMRFLGHSADINCIATTTSDPNNFVTAASDGGIRLYDIRQPTPRFAIEHGDEKIHSALYEYIGGQPFIIYGTLQSQQIKVWDVRNRAPLFELATGNNSVADLAWDAANQTLLAVTECDNMDRHGSVHDYRWAHIGSHGKEWLGDSARFGGLMGAEHASGDDEDEMDSEDDEDDFEFGWPNDAWHVEKSFGVAFDAGDHRIFRYQFKSDADPKILPEYGDATPENAGSYW
uniref:WD40 repeat-containing protein n=1 Tax=Mycena chlorophos TaxID=658473 RepID=A0ABQ0KW96_MYCCL|nr:WD40 repeat-containing protein [Mycena chlorophos]